MGDYPPAPFFYDGKDVTYQFHDRKGNVYYRLHANWKANDLLVQAPTEGFAYPTPAGEWVRLSAFVNDRFVSEREGKAWSLSKKTKDEAEGTLKEFFKEWPYFPSLDNE